MKLSKKDVLALNEISVKEIWKYEFIKLSRLVEARELLKSDLIKKIEKSLLKRERIDLFYAKIRKIVDDFLLGGEQE